MVVILWKNRCGGCGGGDKGFFLQLGRVRRGPTAVKKGSLIVFGLKLGTQLKLLKLEMAPCPMAVGDARLGDNTAAGIPRDEAGEGGGGRGYGSDTELIGVLRYSAFFSCCSGSGRRRYLLASIRARCGGGGGPRGPLWGSWRGTSRKLRISLSKNYERRALPNCHGVT